MGIMEDKVDSHASENEIRESELKYKRTLNSIGDPIHLVDGDLRIHLINPAFMRWLEELGLNTQVLGMKLLDAFPFLSSSIVQEYEEVFTTGKTLYSVETISLNNQEIITETRKIPVSQGDTVVQVLTMVRDITKQKQTVKAVRESEQWFKSIFRDSPIAINVFNAEGKLRAANQAMLDFAGVSDAKDFAKLNIFDDPNTPDEDKEKMRCGEPVFFERTFDFDLVKKSKIYPTKKSGVAFVIGGITPLRNETSGEIEGYIVQIVDETSKVETKRILNESEILFRSVFEQSPIAIELFNLDGSQVRTNQAAIELFGSSFAKTDYNLFTNPIIPKWAKGNLQSGEAVRFDTIVDLDNVIESNSYPTENKIQAYLDVQITPLDIDDDGSIDALLSQIRDITAEKRSAAIVRESETRFRGIFEQSPLAIEWFDLDGKLDRANQSSLELFGLASIDDYRGFNLYADPNTPNWVKDNLRNGKSARFELEFNFEQTKASKLYPTTKSGIIYLDVLHTPIDIDGDGIIDGILSQIQDITTRKLAEDSLRESEENLDLALQGAALGTWSHFISNRSWKVSARFAEITGYSTEDFEAGRITWKQLIHPDDFQYVAEQWNLHESEKSTLFSVEYRLQTKSGEWKWVLDRGKLVQWSDDGSPLRSAGTLLDITDRKIAEQDLLESEERYRLMADSIQDGLTIFENNQVIYANARACEIFGYSLDEFLTKDPIDLAAPEEVNRIQQMTADTMKTGVYPEQMDFWTLRKDGQRRYVSNRFSFRMKSDGTTVRYIVTTDMTEQKRIEGTLERQANALNERVKELTCRHETTRLLASEESLDHVFNNFVKIMQIAWPYHDITCVKVEYLHEEFTTSVFTESQRVLSEKLQVSGEIVGELSVYYSEDQNTEEEGPFLREERNLLKALSDKLGSYLEGKIAQHALTYSENKYRSVVETATSVIILLSADGRIKEFNKEAERVFGYSLQEVEGKNYLDLFVPRLWHQRLEEHFTLIVTGDAEQGFENPIITRNGDERIFLWDASLIFDEDDKPSILGIGQDITERKKAEVALQESEARYRYLFDNLADGVAIIDTNGKIAMCNDRLPELFGLTSDEALGSSFAEFLHPASRDDTVTKFMRGLQEEASDPNGLDVLALRKDGSTIYIHVSNTILRENNQVIGYQSVIRDITSEKESEKTILEERDRAQGYLDIAGAVIVVLNKHGVVELINQRGSEILGYSIDDVLGKNWIENFIPGHTRIDVENVFLKLMSGEISEMESNENPVLTSNGDERIIEWRNSVIFDSNGIPTGTMSSGVDVTERRHAEDNLQNTADTAMLYLDIMGHDIRNHLQAIVMGTDIMGHYELGAEIEPIFELIVESVENSQKLIDQVQATRALLSTPQGRIPLLETIINCKDLAVDIFNDVEFNLISNIDSAYVVADEFLKLLCRNLIDNAVRHNTNKDRIVWIIVDESNDGFAVTIQDNGPGIPDERKEYLFDTGRRFGGVGIHQAKNIVEKYGGLLSVGNRIDEDSGQGASFTFWLPRANEDLNGEGAS